jgi:hypothetical protein
MAEDQQFFTNVTIEMLAQSTTDFIQYVPQIWYYESQL